MDDSYPRASGGDTVVLVPLLDEGVDVWRPVVARPEAGGYRLPVEAPVGEKWAVAAGELAKCRRDSDGSLIVIGSL